MISSILQFLIKCLYLMVNPTVVTRCQNYIIVVDTKEYLFIG